MRRKTWVYSAPPLLADGAGNQEPPKNESEKLPAREELDQKHKWRLEDIYPSDAAWEDDFKRAKELMAQLKEFQGNLTASPARLLAGLKLRDQLAHCVEKLYVYARMRRDEDNRVGKYQALASRALSLSTEAASAEAFMEPEILRLPEEKLQHYLTEEAELRTYRHYLEDVVRHKPHILSEAEEALLAGTYEIAEAPHNVFTMLNDADMDFGTIVDEKGREVELTHGRYLRFMQSRERRVRKEAFTKLYNAYQKQENTLAALLHASVNKDVFYARVRKYPSALQAALFGDNVPIEVYENLIGVVRDNLDVFHRYLDIRKKALGLDEMHMYDVYVPVVEPKERDIPYRQAWEMATEALRPLGEEYLRDMSGGRDGGWVDIFENVGKTSGAYSWGAYGIHPYVLLNYQGRLNDVFTLAHEFGHAMHSFYSNNRQPYIYADYSIFLAEVASTVNEVLLTNHLLETTSDPKEKLYLINHYLEEFRGTVYRQTMFAEFEKIIHEQVEKGEPLTLETLCEVYGKLNADYFGPGVVQDEQIAMEWARIPHFYRSFYVYKYATGFSAAVALAGRILTEGEEARRRYLDFLGTGSSDYPLNLLRQAGADMSKPEPIEAALAQFGDKVAEMEQLITEVGL